MCVMQTEGGNTQQYEVMVDNPRRRQMEEEAETTVLKEMRSLNLISFAAMTQTCI